MVPLSVILVFCDFFPCCFNLANSSTWKMTGGGVVTPSPSIYPSDKMAFACRPNVCIGSCCFVGFEGEPEPDPFLSTFSRLFD